MDTPNNLFGLKTIQLDSKPAVTPLVAEKLENMPVKKASEVL
jgi:hypothetical protein